jgi:transposase
MHLKGHPPVSGKLSPPPKGGVNAFRERDLEILVNYTNSFKAKMVQRMSPPNAISAIGLSKEVGVSQSQLSRWLRVARTVTPMAKERRADPTTQVGGARSAEEKVRIVMAAAALPPGELGAFLRREGVHEAELEQWRTAILEAGTSALESGAPKPSARGGDSKRIKELERELRRKDKALAETAALLVLQKKVREIWGDGDDDTDEKNGK